MARGRRRKRWGRVVVVAVVAAVAAALVAGRDEPSPGQAAPLDLTLAFVSDRDGRPAVWLLGSGVEEKLSDLRSPTGPAGGRQDAYAPAWGPCGDALAFVAVADDDQAFSLVVVDLQTERSREVYSAEGVVGSVTWSPARGIALEVGLPDGSQELRVVDPADGSARTVAVLDERRYGNVRWHPTRNEFVAAYATDSGRIQIVRINGSTGAHEILVSDGYAPTWSSDGSHLLFVQPTDTGWRLVLADADGRSRRALYQSSQLLYGPAFALDERFVLFEEYSGEAPDLVLFDTRTPDRTELLAAAGFDGAVAVRPGDCSG